MSLLSRKQQLLPLYLLLATACATLDEPSPADTKELHALHIVSVKPLSGARLRLTLPPLPAEPAFQRFSTADARRVLAQFHEDLARLKPGQRRRASVEVCTSTQALMTRSLIPGSPSSVSTVPLQPTPLEHALREQYTERYGEPLFPLPPCLEGSPLLMALRLSPRHMPQGVREGWEELVKDPAFLTGMATALVIYGLAWVAPEPIFTKAFAASVTVVLVTLFSVAELTHFGMVALRLCQDTQKARSLEEIEAAAELFGRYLGGAGVRVLAFIAMRGVGKSVHVPQGGLWKLWPPRLALPGGYTWSTATSVQAVPAQATLIVSGVALGSGTASLRSACKDLSEKAPGYSRHHLATDKNRDSNIQGGPWTPLFEEIFADAGMGLDDEANLVNLLHHAGPHPKEYHIEIYRRLRSAVAGCFTQHECRTRLLKVLREIAEEVCTPGTELNRLATRSRP